MLVMRWSSMKSSLCSMFAVWLVFYLVLSCTEWNEIGAKTNTVKGNYCGETHKNANCKLFFMLHCCWRQLFFQISHLLNICPTYLSHICHSLHARPQQPVTNKINNIIRLRHMHSIDAAYCYTRSLACLCVWVCVRNADKSCNCLLYTSDAADE